MDKKLFSIEIFFLPGPKKFVKECFIVSLLSAIEKYF